MKRAAFVSAILAGYGAISLGTLKLLWRLYGGHFYSVQSPPEPLPPLPIDLALILVLIGGGLVLVTLRSIIPALLTVLAVCIFEVVSLQSGPHQFWQACVVTGVIVGQVLSLYLNLLYFFDAEKRMRQNETW